MSFITISFAVLLSILFYLSNADSVSVHPYWAARCIGHSDGCSKFEAKYSGSCKMKTKYWNQPLSCRKFACGWCTEFLGRSNKYPCNAFGVKQVCKDFGPSKPKNNNPIKPNGKCIWTGKGNNAVIDLGAVPLAKGWKRVFRSGMKGIQFVTSPARGISPKGRYGKMCFNVKAGMSGKYYLTALSYAPHPTEHNDVWVESSKGFDLYKHGRFQRKIRPGSWTKAYQNNGKKGISKDFKTIDFNGHQFLIPNVIAGQSFRVCLAGRSKKYEMYKVILYKCDGGNCKGGVVDGNILLKLKPSKCF